MMTRERGETLLKKAFDNVKGPLFTYLCGFGGAFQSVVWELISWPDVYGDCIYGSMAAEPVHRWRDADMGGYYYEAV